MTAMHTGLRFGQLAISVLLGLLAGLGPAHAEWVKGNTHGHSTLSDGNRPPEEALAWYRDHGYGFTFLTDHNTCAPASVFAAASTATFLALPGEELSSTAEKGVSATHVNALGLCRADSGDGPALDLAPITAPKARAVLTDALAIIEGAGAIAQLNHPTTLLTDPTGVELLPHGSLVEVYNHGVGLSALAPMAIPLFEKTYDAALTAGRHVWCVASDDTHRYEDPAPGIPDTPGGGWVMVRVESLTPENVLAALRSGDFYGSTGVTLEDVGFYGTTYRLRIAEQAGVTYATDFIGAGGTVLATVEGPAPRYTLTGAPAETYVRAKVRASDGTAAWVQPVWPG